MHSSAIIITLLGCGCSPSPWPALSRLSSTASPSSPGSISLMTMASSAHSKYQSADGATVQETGFLKPTNDKTDYVLAKQGSFSYTSPEGVPVQVVYTADEYGFHPTGNVLPVGPAAVQPTF
ncbi:endocuticle structural glycoprotein SgAbd-1-like [Homalodisca vitripennis]|uniref:endocuticle structural glycoprotein SgAbd-1-like n=1 Tax=Homalodisca vitripennis TaxID=197043 RepID=UPI001EEB18B3|nr:endocuticle structural glycoprotein SgAbd-1-like [Homalodisca vitripennis]